MRYDRECLYDVEWQKIRCEMLGHWGTLSEANTNVYVLRRYCETDSSASYERGLRCSNYMAAIMLGYGSRAQFAGCYVFVSSAQKMFAGLANSTSTNFGTRVWNWSKVEADLAKTDSAFLRVCNTNLKKRVYTSIKRTGGTQHRPELMKFVSLLQHEMTSRGLVI